MGLIGKGGNSSGARQGNPGRRRTRTHTPLRDSRFKCGPCRDGHKRQCNNRFCECCGSGR